MRSEVVVEEVCVVVGQAFEEGTKAEGGLRCVACSSGFVWFNICLSVLRSNCDDGWLAELEGVVGTGN